MEHATLVIGDKHVASFVVQTLGIVVTPAVVALLDNEAKIDAETLVTLCSMTRVVSRSVAVADLGFQASRAAVHF